MEQKRRKFQGALNILSFNRHFYVAGLAVLLLVVLSHSLLKWSDPLFYIVLAAFLYGLIMPLLVSAYVYDFSGYYDAKWMKPLIRDPEKVSLIANVNAGFDEMSYIIKDRFPQADLRAFDFYNAKQHTEVAIKRARKVSLIYPDTRHVASNRLPLGDHSVDIVFLLSAIHEIRSNEEKILFLTECHRICKLEGQVIMVEHLRDFPNFLAFSVGFTHFFSRAVWKRAFESAGFATFRETKFAPFMSIFECAP